MDWIRVNDWDDWQSYRTDRPPPPWLKVYKSIANKPKWLMLSDAERGQLVAIWIAAADHNGWVPNDASILKEMARTKGDIDLNKLIELKFLDAKLTSKTPRVVVKRVSKGRQTDAPEAKAKAKAKAKADSNPPIVPPRGEGTKGHTVCSESYQPSSKVLEWSSNKGIPDAVVFEAADEMRNWSRGGGKKKKDWDATLMNWIREKVRRERPLTRSPMDVIGEEINDREARRARSGEGGGRANEPVSLFAPGHGPNRG